MERVFEACFWFYIWVIASIVLTRLVLWGLERDRWSRRGSLQDWAVKLVVAYIAAKCIGMV